MPNMTRKRWVGFSSALTMALVLVLMLTTMASADSPIVHRVSAGGPDICEAFGLRPGCDANFSLVAQKRADGTVTGQYTDRWPHGNGFHATIDCLVVVGNTAWLGGEITQGRYTDPNGVITDLTGQRVSTVVQDNGRSSHDPADKVSMSHIVAPPYFDCATTPPVDLYELFQGQVRVD